MSTKTDLTTATAAAGIRLQATNGAFLTLQVADPNGKIQDIPDTPLVNGKPAPRGNFRIFTVLGTHYMPAKLLSVSGGIRQYGLAVPKTATLLLYVDTSLLVAD